MAQDVKTPTRVRRTVQALVLTTMAAACATPSATPAPSPAPRDASVPERVPAVRRVSLPTRLADTRWDVTSSSRLRLSTGETQRVESRGRVSWQLERSLRGDLRGTGQVDAFTVRASFDTASTAAAAVPPPGMPPVVRLEAVMDSTTSRVVTRPPLANECDRPEASAAALARELLVRVPDGLAAGTQWRDSTVTLVCRSGVPMTVYTISTSTLERIDADVLVVRRELSSTVEGRGGNAFRSLTVTGTGLGTQRLEIDALRGTLGRLEGRSTVTLQVTEHVPPQTPKVQRVVQETELRASVTENGVTDGRRN